MELEKAIENIKVILITLNTLYVSIFCHKTAVWDLFKIQAQTYNIKT